MSNFTPLLPLFINQESDKILNLIEKKQFNPLELTDKGNNLLTIAIFFNKWDIAQKLIEFNTKDNIVFPLQLQENSLDLFESMIQSQDSFDTHIKFLQENYITLQFDFLKIINLIKTTNCNLFNDIKNVEKLKKLLINSIDDIKSLDPLVTIKHISQTNSPLLSKLYFDICEFDNLPIQQHPAFIIFKDVLGNPEKYYDYYVFSTDDEQKKSTFNLNNKSIKALQKKLSNLKTLHDFYAYFKNKDTVLNDIQALQLISNCGKKSYSLDFPEEFSPQIEINRFYEAIQNLSLNQKSKKTKHFFNDYLINWSHYYFKNKILHSYDENNIVFNEKYKKFVDKYQFKYLVISKDSNLKNVFLSLKKSIKELKSMFGISNQMIGDELYWLFIPLKEQGYFRRIDWKLVISNNLTSYDTASTIIHEYTHYLQNLDKSINPLKKLEQGSKKWVNYPIAQFSQYLFNFLQKDFSNDMLSHKEKWLSLISASIKNFTNPEEVILHIQNNAFSLLKHPVSYEKFIKYNLHSEEILKYINLYYLSQNNKDYSYDYYLWKANDDHLKEYGYEQNMINGQYWTAPHEIHARLNQSLYEEKIHNTYSDINPVKLSKIKNIIYSLNEKYSFLLEKEIYNKKEIHKSITEIRKKHSHLNSSNSFNNNKKSS